MGTEPIARFFDREADACCRAGPDRGDGVAGISSVLLERVEEEGLAGRSVADLGCGMGGLAIEALRRGASRVDGVDLSPASIDIARRRATAAGLAERAGFRSGDAASTGIEPHDVVVLDKSLCCYPDPDRLLTNAVPAARRLLAFSVPASMGLRGWLAKAAIFLENAWRAIRGDPFRAFVHDVRRLDARIRREGFRLRSTTHHWMWHVAVYARPAGAPGP